MMKHTVSVVVPTYLQTDSLIKALKSLTIQTFKDFDVIIVDDNANHHEIRNQVVEIINQFKSKLDILYLINENNLGSAKSRNRGIFASNAEYITFLDDDDTYLENNIKNKIDTICKFDTDIVISNMIFIDETGKLIEKRNRFYFDKSSCRNKDELLVKHLKYHITGTDCMMFNSKFLKKIEGFGEQDLGDEFYIILKAINNNASISHSSTFDSVAVVHNNIGLSSGENKIKCENILIEEKRKYFSKISRRDIKYINMRHYIVLAYAYKKNNNTLMFAKQLLHGFVLSPVRFIIFGLNYYKK